MDKDNRLRARAGEKASKSRSHGSIGIVFYSIGNVHNDLCVLWQRHGHICLSDRKRKGPNTLHFTSSDPRFHGAIISSLHVQRIYKASTHGPRVRAQWPPIQTLLDTRSKRQHPVYVYALLG